MKLWKCTNCINPQSGVPGVDFFADDGKCPTCGLSKDHPRFGGKVVECVITHFEPSDEIVKDAGTGLRACEPTKAVGHQAGVATRRPDYVTCPLCRQTEAWRKENAKAADGPNTVPLAAGGLASDILKAASG